LLNNVLDNKKNQTNMAFIWKRTHKDSFWWWSISNIIHFWMWVLHVAEFMFDFWRTA